MIDVKVLSRDEDSYEALSQLVPHPCDYFDFPSSALAFAESRPTSLAVIINGITLFRLHGNTLTLISYWCSAKELFDLLDNLHKEQYKIKSLNYVNKSIQAPLQTFHYMQEYYLDEAYNLHDIIEITQSRKVRKNLRRAVRNIVNYDLIDPVQADAESLFHAWVEDAKKRHFMVVQGHYWRYIQRYYLYRNNVTLAGVIRKSDKTMRGLIGYESVGNQVQLTLMKSLTGEDWDFPLTFWMIMIELVKCIPGVGKVYCGTTADDLKVRLGMNYVRSYKLKL